MLIENNNRFLLQRSTQNDGNSNMLEESKRWFCHHLLSSAFYRKIKQSHYEQSEEYKEKNEFLEIPVTTLN